MSFITHNKKVTDDQELIRLYKETGNLQPLGQLFEKYLPLIYGICLRYFEEDNAKDATMQIFEELIPKLKRHEVKHFKSWLHVLTRNHCLMELRKRNRKEGHLAALNEEKFMEKEEFVHHDDDHFGENKKTDTEMLRKCIETLAKEQRTCVDMFYLKGKSYREITSQTGYELKKVKSYIQNGKRNLKNCIEKQKHV